MRRWKTVVIGYGYAGRIFHSYLVERAPGLELVGICARDPEKQQQARAERGVRVYGSYDEVLADRDVELVVLATPHDTHADMAVAGLDAGKHVVTDKVMCLNMDEYRRMRQAADRSGKLLTVFHNRRWDGDWMTVTQLAESGRLGEIHWAELSWNRHGPWRGWRGQREKGGGRVYDLGAHLLDQALLLFPQPITGVHALIQRKWPGFDVESQSMLAIEFDGGAKVTIDTGCLTRYTKPRYHIVGTAGTFVKFGVDPQEDALKVGDIDAAREDESQYGTLYDAEGAHTIPTNPGRWRTFYEWVARALDGEAPPPVTLDQMARVIATLDAAFESERTGQVVRPTL